MKRYLSIVLFVIVTFAVSQVIGQDEGNFYDEFKDYAEDEIDRVATPIVEAFGTAVGGGLYHTAATHGVLGFDVGVRAMMVMIPEGESDILDSSDVTFFPVPAAQLSVGLPMDFEVMVRGFSVKFEDETISLFGAGIKKNITPHLPMPGLPDISAMIAYHSFKASDVLTSSHISFNLMVSKKFLIITPYAGFGFDKTSMDIEYTYVDNTQIIPIEVPVSHTIDASSGRFTVGLNLTPFPFIKIFGDYNLGKFSEISAGLAVSIR